MREFWNRCSKRPRKKLGRVGFSGLRIEDVALRSGVNKTTIYRRWPSKSDLIAALLDREKIPLEDVDSGNLESDIRETLRQFRTRLYTVRHRGILRVLMGERVHPEVAQMVRETRARHVAMRQRIFERAMERGEIPQRNAAALVEFMTAPLASRIMHLGQEVDDDYIELLTQVIKRGVRRRCQRRSSLARRSSRDPRLIMAFASSFAGIVAA